MPKLPAGERFNATNGPAKARNSHRMRPGRQLRQMIDAQQTALQLATSDAVEDKSKVGYLRAYHDLTRLIMDFTGHGKPKLVPAKNDKSKERSIPRTIHPAE